MSATSNLTSLENSWFGYLPQDLNYRLGGPSRRNQGINHIHPLYVGVVVGQLVVVLDRLEGRLLAEHPDMVHHDIRLRSKLGQERIAHGQPRAQHDDQPDLPRGSGILRRLDSEYACDFRGGGAYSAAGERAVAEVVDFDLNKGVGGETGVLWEGGAGHRGIRQGRRMEEMNSQRGKQVTELGEMRDGRLLKEDAIVTVISRVSPGGR